MEEKCAPYLQWIHGQKDPALSLLQELAEINSHSYNQQGLLRILNRLEDAFSILPAKMEKILLPEGKCALSLRKKGKGKPIFLCGHMDTVFPKEAAFQKTTQIGPNILKGPGVADMKGGLVVMLTALKALERSPFGENVSWEVLIVPDEEIGSPFSCSLFQKIANRCSVGLIFEPTLPDGKVVVARKGSLNLHIVAKGKAAHAGRDFFEGRSAILSLAHFLHEARSLAEEGVIFNVGKIQGGTATNVVADFAEAHLNIRSESQEGIDTLLGKLQQLAKTIGENHGAPLHIQIHSARPPKKRDEKTEQLLQEIEQCAKKLGRPFTTTTSGGTTDGNNFAALGLANIDTMGVRGGKLHTEEEYMEISSLTEQAELTAYFLMKKGECA